MVSRSPALRRLAVLATAVLVTLAGLTTTAGAAPEPAPGGDGLPRLDVSGTYVAGISSGGEKATPPQGAHSRRVGGGPAFHARPDLCAPGHVARTPPCRTP